MSTVFTEYEKELLMIRPNKKNSSYLDVNLYNLQRYEDGCIDSFSLKEHETFALTKDANQPESMFPDSPHPIVQIESRTFDEEVYFDYSKTPKQLNELIVSLNYDNRKVQTCLLKLNKKSAPKIEPLYELDFDSELVHAIDASNMIQAECAILEYEQIYLASEKSTKNSLQRVADNLRPMFNTKYDQWKNVKFGAQPRSLIYSDNTQIFSIDTRIKMTQNKKDLFNVKSSYLKSPHEKIQGNQVLLSDFNAHLVCLSKCLVLLDERYATRPLLMWSHNLKSPSILMNNFHLSNRDYLILTDTNKIYSYEFSLKEKITPVSYNFPLKLDSPKDVLNYLPDSTDKRLTRALKFKLNQPIKSLSTLKSRDSFTLFQVSFLFLWISC